MNLHIITDNYYLLFLAGMSGALVVDMLKDNCIVLPKKVGDILNLGFIGSVIIGGFAGCVIDGSLLTAFMGGFMGKEVIENLVVKQNLDRRKDDNISDGRNA